MITVAIVGGGFMGSTHAAGWKALAGRARVKVVCSRSPERGGRVAAVAGASFSTDLDRVLEDPDIDAVDICLPTGLHRPVSLAALAAGKHVLLEKPIALTAADAEAIVEAAATSGRTLMVALVLRFFPEYEEIERRVRSGALGKPLGATAYRLSPPADWNTWMQDESQSGGTPVDDMVHDFDQLNVLFGAPRTVFARALPGARGHVQALVGYDGAEALVEASSAMPSSYPFSAGIRVLCERGAIEHEFRSVPAGEGNIGAADESYVSIYPAGGEPERLELPGVEPWTAEIAYFAECIEQQRRPERGTPEQAYRALQVSLATVRSLRSGRPEAIP
jgi:predicted dehydrogenase